MEHKMGKTSFDGGSFSTRSSKDSPPGLTHEFMVYSFSGVWLAEFSGPEAGRHLLLLA